MARRRKGQPVHGWLILDKPIGLTSTAAVSRIKRLFDAAKAGHAGTLDPLATGVLPIALGEATKTVPFVMEGAKSYRFTVCWGRETDTDDGEGETVRCSEARPDQPAIEAALSAFVGDIMQVPPTFSAVKVEGERAYDLAREGEDFELAARPARIDRLELVAIKDADHAEFEADCAKDVCAPLGAQGGRIPGACSQGSSSRRRWQCSAACHIGGVASGWAPQASGTWSAAGPRRRWGARGSRWAPPRLRPRRWTSTMPRLAATTTTTSTSATAAATWTTTAMRRATLATPGRPRRWTRRSWRSSPGSSTKHGGDCTGVGSLRADCLDKLRRAREPPRPKDPTVQLLHAQRVSRRRARQLDNAKEAVQAAEEELKAARGRLERKCEAADMAEEALDEAKRSEAACRADISGDE